MSMRTLIRWLSGEKWRPANSTSMQSLQAKPCSYPGDPPPTDGGVESFSEPMVELRAEPLRYDGDPQASEALVKGTSRNN